MYRFGAATAQLHQIELEPSAELPSRMRPIEIEDFTVGRAESGSAALLTEAERLIAEIPRPTGRSVLLHGDLWHGNTLREADRLTAFIDWDSAGVGHPGLDLASVRLDAAMMFGQSAAEEVLAGYLDRSAELGVPALSGFAYFDVVAALSTPADMLGWVPNIAGQGRRTWMRRPWSSGGTPSCGWRWMPFDKLRVRGDSSGCEVTAQGVPAVTLCFTSAIGNSFLPVGPIWMLVSISGQTPQSKHGVQRQSSSSTSSSASW